MLTNLAPIYMLFLLGVLLRKAGVFSRDDGQTFLRAVFYVCLPALILVSLSTVRFSRELLYLPIIGVLVVSILSVPSMLLGKGVSADRRVQGAFVVGTLIMNIGVIYAVALPACGAGGVALVAMYDIGQGVMAYSVVYAIACAYGQKAPRYRSIVKRIGMSPPLWAIAVALALNATGRRLVWPLAGAAESLGNATMPLVMLAMGMCFSARSLKSLAVVWGVFVRMVMGAAVGLVLAELFGIGGLPRLVVVMCSGAPVGYNTLTFAAAEGLDVELAAGLVTISMMFGAISIPIIMLLLPP